MTHGHRFLIQSKSRDIKGSSDLMASSFSLITHSGTKGGKLILLKKLILLCKKRHLKSIVKSHHLPSVKRRSVASERLRTTRRVSWWSNGWSSCQCTPSWPPSSFLQRQEVQPLSLWNKKTNVTSFTAFCANTKHFCLQRIQHIPPAAKVDQGKKCSKCLKCSYLMRNLYWQLLTLLYSTFISWNLVKLWSLANTLLHLMKIVKLAENCEICILCKHRK